MTLYGIYHSVRAVRLNTYHLNLDPLKPGIVLDPRLPTKSNEPGPDSPGLRPETVQKVKEELMTNYTTDEEIQEVVTSTHMFVAVLLKSGKGFICSPDY